jgi:phage/plasmid-like protein (TIGR03299 family)
MAHLLNFNGARGTWSFASHSEKAWHGLGQIVDKAMTAEEAIKLANLDYEVSKANVQFLAEEGNYPINGYFATYRTDNKDYLGMVKSRYEIVQNKDAFAFFDAIIDSGEAIFETAGALGRGEKVFLMAKLPEDILVGGEKIEKYILLTNSHDGSSSILAGLTNIRVVCNNTLQAALKGLDNRVSIDHVSGAKDKLKEAARVMGLASKYSVEVGEVFNTMVDYKMTEGQYHEFFSKILKPDYVKVESEEEKKDMSTKLKNIIDGTLQFAMTHNTQTTAETKNTLWGAYNAVSGYFNYVKSYKTAEDKFSSQFFGAGNKKILKAFSESVALINQ